MAVKRSTKNVVGLRKLCRLFIFLFRLDIHKLPTAVDLFNAVMKDFNINKTRCPGCGSKGYLTYHDEYSHHLVDYYSNQIQGGSVEIRMISCSSCKNTYSVLPDLFVPHKSYSILYIMLVLRAYFLRTESVEAICERYGIAVSTLYRWKKRFCTHKSLKLDKLQKYFFKSDPYLTQPCNICATSFLYDFYNTFGFSFLQYSKAAQSHSP